MQNGINGWWISMHSQNTDFSKTVGQRVARLRGQQGLTQTRLADALGIKQYVIASYETGRRRIPSALLPALAQNLGVSVETLLGVTSGKNKPGPASRLERQINQVRRLPESKQRFVSEFLDTVLQQARQA